MKNKFFVLLIGLVMILVVGIVFWNHENSVHEEIIFRESEVTISGDDLSGTNMEETSQEGQLNASQSSMQDDNTEYDVNIDDETITFTTKDGSSSIIYIFENNHLDNVLQIIAAESASAAEYLKNQYEKEIGNGIIDRVVVSDNMISIRYAQDYFKEYRDYTKSEIEDLLLYNENTTIIESGEIVE